MPDTLKATSSVLFGLLIITHVTSARRVLPENHETYLEVDPEISTEPPLTEFRDVFGSEEPLPLPIPTITTTRSLIQIDNYNSTSRRTSHVTEISRAFFPTRPPNTPPNRNTWGSHPVGSKESFEIEENNRDLKWIAYFYDQAVVAVLQTVNGTILKCTVQENIQKWEQEEALQYLSEVMPLRPIAFDSMVHLITICGTLNIPSLPPTEGHHSGSSHSWWLDFSAIQGILPGTLWCGVRDRATYYRDLGSKQKVDNCCRGHDHCPIKVSGLTHQYGVINLGLNTLSHCSCDLEFYRCLKAANTDAATMVGQVYFNYLDIKCLDAPPKTKTRTEASDRPPRGSRPPQENRKEYGTLKCVKYDEERECRKWELIPSDFSVELMISRLGLKF